MSAIEFTPEELEIRGARRVRFVQNGPSYDGNEALQFVAKKHRLAVKDVMGRSHSKRVVAARHELYGMLRDLGWSLPEIGRFCRRDHSTVMMALRKRPPPDPLFRRAMAARAMERDS